MVFHTPNPWQEFHARANQIVLAIDSLGDTTYQLLDRYVSSDERRRLMNETNDALERMTYGLNELARVAEQARELSRHLAVRNQEDVR